MKYFVCKGLLPTSIFLYNDIVEGTFLTFKTENHESFNSTYSGNTFIRR